MTLRENNYFSDKYLDIVLRSCSEYIHDFDNLIIKIPDQSGLAPWKKRRCDPDKFVYFSGHFKMVSSTNSDSLNFFIYFNPKDTSNWIDIIVNLQSVQDKSEVI